MSMLIRLLGCQGHRSHAMRPCESLIGGIRPAGTYKQVSLQTPLKAQVRDVVAPNDEDLVASALELSGGGGERDSARAVKTAILGMAKNDCEHLVTSSGGGDAHVSSRPDCIIVFMLSQEWFVLWDRSSCMFF